MPDIWLDVDAALSEVPVNIMPLLDDTDFKTRETAVAYNAAGMDLVWNFTTPAGATTQTAVTPTTGGDYDWVHQGDGMYTIEIPASAGASINNDTEGFGWFTGFATGVLPWRGPIIGFRAAGLNDKMIESAYDANRGLSGLALPAAAAEASGGLYTRGSGAGQITQDANGRVNVNLMAILNTTLTETAGQIAGGFKKFFDVAAPTGTLNSLPAAIAGAANGLFIAGVNAATSITTALTANIIGNVTGNLSGSVGSVTGAVGSVTGAVGSVTGAVGSVTGNVGGNVAGSVGSVTAAVTITAASIQAIWDALTSALTTVGSIGKLIVDNLNATISSRMATYTQPTGFLSATFPSGTVANTTNITAGVITTTTNLTNAPTAGDFTATMKTSLNAATPVVTVSDKTGFSLSAAGIQAIWDALTAALTTVGSIGKLLVDNINATISSRLASASYTTPPTTAQIADKVLGRSIQGGADGGRTVMDALRILRNRRTIAAGTLTAYQEDDTTPAWTAAVATAAGNPVSDIDPA